MSILYEHFNTTNQTSPHFEKHLFLINSVIQETCERITILDASMRCNFSITSPACEGQVYTAFYFCYLQSSDTISHVLGTLFLLAICVFYFWTIDFVTNTFLCPALTEVSKIFHMNEYVAGATIVAFGNGAPEIFTSIAGIDNPSRHIFSESMAGSLYITIFISAVVIWTRPFTIDPFFLLRDIGFVCLYTICIDIAIKSNHGIVTRSYSLCLVAVYFSYIMVVIIDQYLLLRKRKFYEIRYASESSERSGTSVLAQFKKLQSQAFLLSRSRWVYARVVSYESPNYQLWPQFFSALKTFDYEEFKESSHAKQLCALMKCIPMCLIYILIPHINFETKGHVWSKLLCSVQCTISPTLVIYYILSTNWNIYNIPIIATVFCIFLCLGGWVFYKSRTDRVPDWYKYVLILSVILSVTVVHVVASEIIKLMQTLGILLKRSHVFIGTTFYTWGIGLGDLIANMSLARQGFPRMAFAACHGATIFSLFVSIAVPFAVQTFRSPTHEILVTEGTIGENCSVMLIVGAIAYIIYALTTNFMMRQSGAVLGIAIYVSFLFFAVSHEMGFMHSYGADHSLDVNQYEWFFTDLIAK